MMPQAQSNGYPAIGDLVELQQHLTTHLLLRRSGEIDFGGVSVIVRLRYFPSQTGILVDAVRTLLGRPQKLADPSPELGAASWGSLAEVNEIVPPHHVLNFYLTEGTALTAAGGDGGHDLIKIAQATYVVKPLTGGSFVESLLACPANVTL